MKRKDNILVPVYRTQLPVIGTVDSHVAILFWPMPQLDISRVMNEPITFIPKHSCLIQKCILDNYIWKRTIYGGCAFLAHPLLLHYSIKLKMRLSNLHQFKSIWPETVYYAKFYKSSCHSFRRLSGRLPQWFVLRSCVLHMRLNKLFQILGRCYRP